MSSFQCAKRGLSHVEFCLDEELIPRDSEDELSSLSTADKTI